MSNACDISKRGKSAVRGDEDEIKAETEQLKTNQDKATGTQAP
jgi:hypothetical protein